MRNGIMIIIALLLNGVLLAQSKAYRKGWKQRLDFTKYALPTNRQEKLKLVMRAIPPESNFYSYYKLYDYYFVVPVKEWNLKSQGLVEVKGAPIDYKLKDIFVLDCNQDGQPDLLHMPTDYGPLTRNSETYFTDLLVSTPKGYQFISLQGYIISYKRNARKQIIEFTTFVNACCDMPASVLRYQLNYQNNQATVVNNWVVPKEQ